MYLSYERTAFYEKEQTGLRITFDSNILWREEVLSLSAGTICFGNTQAAQS